MQHCKDNPDDVLRFHPETLPAVDMPHQPTITVPVPLTSPTLTPLTSHSRRLSARTPLAAVDRDHIMLYASNCGPTDVG